MGQHLLISMVYNSSLLLVMVALYSGIRFNVPFGSALPASGRDVLTGVLVGLMGVALMAYPWILSPGIFFDARSILLGVSGLFFGFIPTVLAAAITSAYRLIVGGAGALPGLAVILGCAGCGLAWGRLRPRLAAEGGLFKLFLFGVTLHLVQLACFLLLPWPLALELLRKVALPLMTIFPLGTVLLSVLLIHQRGSLRKEEELSEKEFFLTESQRLGHIGSWFYKMKKALVWSDEMYRLYGVSPDTFTPTTDSLLEVMHPEDRLLMKTWIEDCAAGKNPAPLEYRAIMPDGKVRVLISSGKLVTGGAETYMAGTVRDVTERRRAQEEKAKTEAQFLQAQKMEAVGRLAGGVAHDFNNILTVINYYCGVLLESYAPGDPRLADAQEILAASKRAEGLTRQLLTFSRRQVIMPKVMDLNKTIADMVRMLSGLIGEDVRLETRLSGTPCLVMADAGQLEQLVMNLAVNARDAMPNGGTITITSEILSPDSGFSAAHQELKRGPLVKLTARDTGHGMTAEVRSHIFEPFFTTKPIGRGTGLGLPAILGIVKQSGGEIEVESEPGKGAAFFVYLPLAAPLEQQAEKHVEKPASLSGTETVLLVEDDRMLRRLGERLLRENGYTVLAAADGKEALEAAERRGRPVDLLLTDVVMPGMSGRELAAELVRRKLVSRTLFMSGYTDDSIVKHGVLEPGIAFLYKPFTSEALSAKIREVLEGPADQAKA